MHVTWVEVSVKANQVDAFIEACKANHNASIEEPGNCRFDVLQDPHDPTQFRLYEAYLNEELAKAHKQTAHYLTWRETVAEMMAEPRKGTAYQGLFPQAC